MKKVLLILHYYIYPPELANDTDFQQFFEKTQNNRRQLIDEENIFDVIKDYKKSKGILNEEKKIKSPTIEWDFKTNEEDGIRCKADDENEINIIVQENFKLDKDAVHEIIYNCTKKFHQNKYKVVVIQSLNGGGWGELSLAMRQLLQDHIKNRNYIALTPAKSIGNAYLADPSQYLNSDTCELYKTRMIF